MALGHCGLVRDTGLRMVVGKVNSGRSRAGGETSRHPAGLWVDRLQHWDGALGSSLWYFPLLSGCKRLLH